MENFLELVTLLKKARALATELRCVLEEAKPLGGKDDLEYEIEDNASAAGEIESWLDDLKIIMEPGA